MWLLCLLLQYLVLGKLLNITLRKYCNVSKVIGCLYTLCSNHNFMEDLFDRYNKIVGYHRKYNGSQYLHVSKGVVDLFC